MPKSSTITIACALCLGATPERFLPAALASIAPAVETLVVNDNSGLDPSANANVATLAASAFASGGRLRVGRFPFVDFADMRNRAFGLLAELPDAPDWVLFLDADEVHGEQLRYVAREILPKLGRDVARVDGYTYHFWGTFGWITDVARRMMFYRYDPALRWVNRVHEKLEGLRGGEIVLPYAYHHYGNVVPPALLARKHGHYYALGNAVPEPVSERDATLDVYARRATSVRPYTAPHPSDARPVIETLRRESGGDFALLDERFAAARTPRVRLDAAVRAMNDGLRVALRRVEHPGLYRETTRAR